MEAARRHEMRFLVVEYPDRLARLGFPYLETLFDALGVHVVIVAGQESEDAQVELVKDLLSIVTCFSARLYGMQGRRKARAAVKAILAETGESAVGG